MKEEQIEIKVEQPKKDIIEETLESKIISTIMPEIKEKVLNEVEDLTKGIKKRIKKIEVLKPDQTKAEQIDMVHEKFEEILTLVNNNIPVMLTGGAGSGKSSTCEKVAQALGLDFYFSNAITQEYKLTGFIDANGKYQETQFYQAFKNGGIFLLDEIDASVPEALVILNTAIANGYFDFPNGKVDVHRNFRIVACANTYGLGGNDVYVGRNQLDGASLDRFAVVYFNYDEVLEKNLVINTEWAEFIQALRKRIQKRQIKHIVSMRATLYGDRLIQANMPIKKILEQVVFKNLQIDDLKSIGTLDETGNIYINEFNKYIS